MAKQRRKSSLSVPQKALVVGVFLIAVSVVGGMMLNARQKGIGNTYPTPTEVTYKKLPPPSVDTSDWSTYSDPGLKFSIKYPSNVMIDPMDNNAGESISFIFTDVDWTNLPRNTGYYESLHIYRRNGVGEDAYKAYTTSECMRLDCDKLGSDSFKKISINNAYGIDLSSELDINYYLTDEKKSGEVIRLVLNNNNDFNQEKIDTLIQMLRTLRFERE